MFVRHLRKHLCQLKAYKGALLKQPKSRGQKLSIFASLGSLVCAAVLKKIDLMYDCPALQFAIWWTAIVTLLKKHPAEQLVNEGSFSSFNDRFTLDKLR